MINKVPQERPANMGISQHARHLRAQRDAGADTPAPQTENPTPAPAMPEHAGTCINGHNVRDQAGVEQPGDEQQFGGEVGGGMSDANVPQTIASTSDDRVVNNIMRHEYRVLSDIEKAHMKEIKDLGLKFVHLLEDIGGVPATPGAPPRMASRALSIAQTKIEEAVMWAVKHITV